MPYQASNQSLFGQPGIPLPPRPQLDVAGAIDAVVRGSSGLIQQAVMRKQRQALIDLEKRRVGLEGARQYREAVERGWVPPHDEPLPSDTAQMASPTPPPAMQHPAPGISVLPSAPPPKPSTIAVGPPRTAHQDWSYDPMRSAKIQQAVTQQTLRNQGAEHAALIRAGTARFQQFGTDVFVTRQNGQIERARDDEGNFITADKPFAFGGRVVMYQNGEIVELPGAGGSSYKMTARPAAAGGGKSGTDRAAQRLRDQLSTIGRQITQQEGVLTGLQTRIRGGNARRSTPATRADAASARRDLTAAQSTLDSLKGKQSDLARQQQGDTTGAPRLSAPGAKADVSTVLPGTTRAAPTQAQIMAWMKTNPVATDETRDAYIARAKAALAGTQ